MLGLEKLQLVFPDCLAGMMPDGRTETVRLPRNDNEADRTDARSDAEFHEYGHKDGYGGYNRQTCEQTCEEPRRPGAKYVFAAAL